MFIADMHSDSLSKVSESRGLISEYNTSRTYPYLQLFAACTPFCASSPEARRQKTMRYLNVFIYECARLGIERIDDVRSLCNATDNSLPSAMFTIEGGGGLFADSEELFTLHKAGLRVMGLVWDKNELGSSSYDNDDEGLTPEGIRMAKRCAELGITVDVSHLSDRGFYDLCEAYPLPIIATHSNFRDVCQSRRNLTADMAKTIVSRGGVIGLNLYPDFLREGKDASVEDVIRHIDYCLERFGDGCLGLGLDIDGTSGKYPHPIDENSSIHDRLIEELSLRYPDATVRKIAGENVTDFFKGVL